MTENLPPTDHFVTSFQFTKRLHRDDYPAIDPTLSQHSQVGKVAIITGATQGIGKGIALSFAKAGVAGLALFSRRANLLEETKAEVLAINPDIKVITIAGDTTVQADADALETAVKESFGFAHVVINVAGRWAGRGSIRDTPVDKWWSDIEVNNKGTYLISALFLRLLGTEKRGYLINVSSFGCNLVVPTCSSYSLSKSFMNRFTEYVAEENPNVIAICYNPGSVATEILDAHPDFAYFSQDSMQLASNVAVYLASERAEFLNGRYMAASWDVEDLEGRKDEIVERNLLKFTLKGEFGPEHFGESK